MSAIASVQPTAAELLHGFALLLAERDALLIEIGRPPKQEGRIEYSRERLDNEGRRMGPVGLIGEEGQLIVRCDL